MRTSLRAALAATAVVGLLAVPSLATAADTAVSFTVASSSTLTVGQASSTATLDDGGSNPAFDALNPGSVSGTLPETTVTDERGELAAAWTVSVVATGDWLNQSDNAITVAASNARAYLDVADATALATALGGALDGMLLTGGEFTVGVSHLGSSYTLLSGTTTLGSGSVVFTPTIDITVPAGTPVGTYTATVQQTVS